MDSSEMNEGEIHQIDSDDVIKEEDETENEEGEDLTEDAEALKAELAKIVVHPPSYEQYVTLNSCLMCSTFVYISKMNE